MIREITIKTHKPILAKKSNYSKLIWYVKGWEISGTYLLEEDTCDCKAKTFDVFISYSDLEMSLNQAKAFVKEFLTKV